MSAPFLPPINAPAPAPTAVPMPMCFAAFFLPASGLRRYLRWPVATGTATAKENINSRTNNVRNTRFRYIINAPTPVILIGGDRSKTLSNSYATYLPAYSRKRVALLKQFRNARSRRFVWRFFLADE